MAHPQEKRDDLRKRYVTDGLSLAMAAVMSEISYPTAQRWKNAARDAGDDWDKVKIAHTMAGGDIEDVSRQILTDFIIQVKSTMEAIRQTEDMPPTTQVELLTSLADAYNKTILASRKLMPETSRLAVAFEVIERLTAYLREHKPALLAQFSDVLEPFGQLIEKELK